MNFTFKSHLIKLGLFLLVSFAFNFQSYSAINKADNYKSLVNHAPVFDSNNYTFTVSETAASGSSAGSVTATDEDGDQLTYFIIAGNTNSYLSIDSASGSIVIAKRLNHHTQNSYTITVKVSDVEGLSAQASVIINVKKAITTPPTFDSVTWSNAAKQPYTVSELQGEVVDSKLYTFGGFDSQKPGYTPTSRAYVFDPVANAWTPIAQMPPMNGTNHGGVTHAGFTTDGTDIYFAGGYTSNTAGTGQKFGTREVWRYIVAENRYERLPDLPITIAAGQLEYLSGKLHHISGTNASRTMDLGNHYVLKLDSLSLGWKTLAPLPNPRQHAGSVVYENKIYFIGGQHGHDTELMTQKDVHMYDPQTNTWTKMADLPVPAGANGRSHISCSAIVFGEYILVLAGETVHNTGRTNMVSVYTPATNTWQNITPMPQTRYSGVAAKLGDMIYYTGGSKSSATFKGKPVQKIDSSHIFIFTGNGNWSNPANWLNNAVPPATLPAGYSIIINGECTLDFLQTISAGASIKVAAGKTLDIQGYLDIQ